jgi:type II secretory ATPase GspE/PulE/Tfp pilus assembly ATPase PilB-like protein
MSTPHVLTNLEDIGPYKGVIKGIVPPQHQQHAVLLDLGCAEVMLIGVRDFFGTSNYLTLIKLITGNDFNCIIKSEKVSDVSLIRRLWIESEKPSVARLIPVINSDNRFIVVYDEIVAKAVELVASDIHFEISDTEFSNVKLRIFGRLKDWKKINTSLLRGALTAAYSKRTKSGTNSSGALSLERAMNTITEQRVGGKTYNGRFNGYPLVNGYDVVMRLLDSDVKSNIPTIESLGYSPYHVKEQIIPAIQRNAGMMVIAGSTGSGKSTALRSFIYSLPDRDSLKIYGVEDPVEYLNPFMRQISVQRTSDDPEEVVRMKFLSALRSVLRMDPDVLMLGEIRDHDSASLASEFNRTGHRVFTTVHGDGCVDVLARLTGEEIGIHPSTLAAKKYLSAVMYQKLLPKLCVHCRKPAVHFLPASTQDTLRHKFFVDPSTMCVANEEGCPHCRVEELGLAGTKGLTVVAEILTPTDAILMAITQRDWAQVERLWRGQRSVGFDHPAMQGKTAFEHALYKATQGEIDPCDIEADFESFATYAIFNSEGIPA